VQGVLVPWLGPPGVFIAAFLDSSFLSLPEINDLLLVTSAATDPDTVWIYATMATLGSLAGCSVLWWIGRRGGEAFLVRRFGKQRVDDTRSAFARWDVLALAIPAVLPPPMPFKIFVLSAGVFGVRYRRLAVTLLVARGLRYAFWGLFGAFYGDEALATLRVIDQWFAERVLELGLLAVGVALAAITIALLRRRRRSASSA
jgi:membrane protein YqaA with SNARE-associated domain